MGSALLAGILRAQLFSAQDIGVREPNLQRAEALIAQWSILQLKSCAEVATARMVVLAVKPQVFPKVQAELAPVLSAESLVISILAGVSLEQLEAAFPCLPIIRAMPNTPALVGAGITALSGGQTVTETQMASARALFSAVGSVLVVPEAQMDAVTALSGSGPGYLAVAIEALIDGGVAVGLPRDIATELALQTVLGTARLLQEEALHPALLKDRVTSPGGTTVAGISVLEDRGVRAALMQAIEAAYRRSQQLRQS
jgi:pyrroline-5-carboxylate reductase